MRMTWVGLVFAGCVAAGIGAAMGGEKERAEWKPLFDGKSLKGWHTQGEPDCWRVEKGELIGELTKPSPYAYLATDRKFGDFELKMQALFESKDGNSGVFFRCYFPPQCAKCEHVARKLPEDVKAFKCPECGHAEALPLAKRVHIGGPQAEFAPPGNNTGALYEGKWLNIDQMNDRKQALHKFHEWNEMVIRAVGDHIQVYLNGEKVSDVEHRMVPEGNIALQLHAGGAMKVRFKDIMIRKIAKPRASRPE